MPKQKILVYGYGNPGRQDDGVGVKCSEMVEEWAISEGHKEVSVDQNYQLNIEDAHKISSFDLVVFTDASVADIEDFKLEEIVPDLKTDFSMHSVTPAFVVGLCKDIFGKHPKSYQLHIKASEFEFMQKMTDEAIHNLKLSLEFLKKFLLKGD